VSCANLLQSSGYPTLDEKSRQRERERQIQLTGNLGLWINSISQLHKDRLRERTFPSFFLLHLLESARLWARS